MSDASGSLEPVAPAAVASTASAGGSDAARQRRERLALIGRILATAGAVLLAVGAWIPWRVVSGYTFVGDQRQDYTLTLSPGDVEGVFGSFAWSALTVVVLLALPLVWWRSQSLITSAALRLNALLVVVSGIAAQSGFSFGGYVRLVPELNPRDLEILRYGPWLVGFWTTLLGVVLLISSAILSIFARSGRSQEMRQGGSTPGARVTRPRAALPGASALTIGMALWAASTFVMPWASVNCNITPLFWGTCTGLSYTSVLRFGIADATTAVDPLVAHYAVGLLLGGGAAMLLAGLWWRARSVAFCGWATLWLALAAVFAWLADNGVGVVVEKHETLGLPAGTWTGENAVLVTLLGFILALVGLGYLWVDAVRNRERRGGNAEV